MGYATVRMRNRWLFTKHVQILVCSVQLPNSAFPSNFTTVSCILNRHIKPLYSSVLPFNKWAILAFTPWPILATCFSMCPVGLSRYCIPLKWRKLSPTFPLPAQMKENPGAFLSPFYTEIATFLVYSHEAPPVCQGNNANTEAPRRSNSVGDLPNCFGHLWISSIKMTAVFHKNAEFRSRTGRKQVENATLSRQMINGRPLIGQIEQYVTKTVLIFFKGRLHGDLRVYQLGHTVRKICSDKTITFLGMAMEMSGHLSHLYIGFA